MGEHGKKKKKNSWRQWVGGSGVKVILEYGSSLGFLYSKDVLSVEFILQKY